MSPRTPLASGAPASLALVALLATFAGAQQDPEPKPPTVTELLRDLRKDSIPAGQRSGVLRRILSDGEGACRRLYKQLHKDLKERGEDLAGDLAEYRADLEKAATRWVLGQQDAAMQAQVAAARDTITGLTRTGGLSKGMLYGEGDTARKVLEGALQADIDKVLAADEDLAAARRAVVERLKVYRARLPELLQVAQVWRGHRSGERGLSKFSPLPPADSYAGLLESSALDAAVRSIPAGGRDRTTLEKNAALRDQVLAEEWRGVLETNRIRLLTGRNALRIDVQLCLASRDHSKDMKDLGFFAHESPVDGKRRFSDRAANFKTSAHAENIAMGRRTGAGAVDGWWHSPGHFKNLLGNHGRIGLGGHGGYWTQMFGG